MDFTLIVDCGTHSVKYAGVSKRNRRKDWPDTQVKEEASFATAPHGPGSSCLEMLWQKQLPSVVSKEVCDGEELTLILLTDPFASRRDREMGFQMAFEHLGAKKVAMCATPATALFAAGSTSGVTVDMGWSGVRVTPVDRGVPVVPLATSVSSVGGSACDAALRRCLLDGGDHASSVATLGEDAFTRWIREPAYTMAKSQVCSFEGAPSSAADDDGANEEAGDGRSHAAGTGDDENGASFTLPDGSAIRFAATPQNRASVTRPWLYSAHANVPASFARVNRKAVVASGSPASPAWLCFGGGAAVPGATDLLAAALARSPFGQSSRQLTARNPITASVDGARILTHLNSFKGMCVSEAEYKEDGPSQCVHVKSVDSR